MPAGRRRRELIAQIRQSLGLDRPVYEQFGIYMKNLVLHVDLGYSYQNNVSVRSEIVTRLPATISLTVGAVLMWMLIGIPVGVISALKPRSLLDRVVDGTGAHRASRRRCYWLGLDPSSCSPRTSGRCTSSAGPAATCRSRRARAAGSRR